MDYLDIQISLDGTDAVTNDAVRGVGSYDTRDPGDGPPPRRRLRPVQDLRRRHPPQRRPARRVQGARRLVTARSCGSPGCVRRVAAPTRGTTCTRPTPSSARSTTGCWPNGDDVLTGDSFFHLNALGEAAARPQHVRCRARRVPHRPDRRRVRLPVRDPRRVQGRLGPRRGRVRPASGSTATCSPSSASRSPPVRARRAAATTPARAAAWRPSSSPACRSTGPTPNASAATARLAARRRRRRWRRGRRWTTPSPPGRRAGAVPVTIGRRWTVTADDGQRCGRRRRTCSARSRARSLVARANGIDIATFGSGNPGASNVTRALGWRKGAWVFGLDALKGALAAGLGLLDRRPAAGLRAAARRRSSATCSRSTRRFRGGKGVATGSGVLARAVPDHRARWRSSCGGW